MSLVAPMPIENNEEIVQGNQERFDEKNHEVKKDEIEEGTKT